MNKFKENCLTNKIFAISQILSNAAINRNYHASSRNQNPIKITEIPLELLLEIYKDLDLYDLANIAVTHPYNWQAAAVTFNDKYFGHQFIIDGQYFHEKAFEYNSTLNALKAFGHLITDLSVNYMFLNSQQSEAINKHLSEYLVDSLTDLKLVYIFPSNLIALTGPFQKVQHVCIRIGEVNNVNFLELFPMARSFDFNLATNLAPECIEHHFPNLEEMRVEITLNNDSPELRRRLQLNPQLRKLLISAGNWNGLRMISENAPSLEHLEFEEFRGESPFDGNVIQLKQLKVFRADHFTHLPHSMKNIPVVFGNLEEIECYRPYNKWFEIIIQNPTLKRIVSGEFSDEQLQRIATELIHLEDFTTGYNVETVDIIDNVVQFFEVSKNLRKVRFYRSEPEICSAILQRLDREWSMVSDQTGSVFFRQQCEP